MAIHIERPERIGEDINAMYYVTNVTGKELVNKFEQIILSLNNNWKGTDAVANLNELAMVYRDTTSVVKKMQGLIVEVNDKEILPLQRHIKMLGGTGGTENTGLSPDLAVADDVTVQTSATASITRDEILLDAENFNSFPEKFSSFVDDLKTAKNKLFQNWIDGANRSEVEAAFKAFETNVGDYISNLNVVRNNLNLVAETKRKLL